MSKRIKLFAACVAFLAICIISALSGCSLELTLKRGAMNRIPVEADYLLGYDSGISVDGKFIYYDDVVDKALKDDGVTIKNAESEIDGVYSSGKVFFSYDYHCTDVQAEDDRDSYIRVKSCTGYIDLSDESVSFLRFIEGKKKYNKDSLLQSVNLGDHVIFYKEDDFIDVVGVETGDFISYDISMYPSHKFFSTAAVFYDKNEILAIDGGKKSVIPYPADANQLSCLSYGWLLYGRYVSDELKLAAINIYTGECADEDKIALLNEEYGYFNEYYDLVPIGDGLYKYYSINHYIQIMDSEYNVLFELTPDYMRQHNAAFARVEKLFNSELDFGQVFVQDKTVYFSAGKYVPFGRFHLDATYTLCFRWDLKGVPQYIGYMPAVASFRFVIPA